MTYRRTTISIALCLFLGSLSLSAQSSKMSSQSLSDTTAIMTLIQAEVVNVLAKSHIEPPEIDDSFSQVLFSNWIEILDPNRLIFYEYEIAELRKDIDQLDDQILNQEVQFFEKSYNLLVSGVDRLYKVFLETKENSLEFDLEEEYIIDRSKVGYAVDEESLSDRYQRYYKYAVLQEFNQRLQEEYQADKQVSATKDSILAFAIETQLESDEVNFLTLRSKDKLHYFSDYLDAITATFDPYSEYYSRADKQSYDVSLNGKLVGVGMRIVAGMEGAVITEIINGGPVWQSGSIEVGEIVVGLATEAGKYIDFKGMMIRDIAAHIRGKIGTLIVLDLLDKNNKPRQETIIRDVVISYDQQVKGLILKSEKTDEEVGYINIRNFYETAFKGKLSSSAIDVIDHLQHFEEAGITSLIIDLRDNLGGILDESILILEALIGDKPFLQIKNKAGELDIRSGDNTEIVYTGDIVVLTNRNTASAAEILASTLQDYDRAIIAGSNTFGKGTIQEFIALDEMSAINIPEGISLGEIKHTFAKYYRVNGSGTQLVGVTPDIPLPSILDSLKIGESYTKNPIAWSKIKELTVEKSDNLGESRRLLRIFSKMRIATSSNFKAVMGATLDVQEFFVTPTMPVSIEAYRAKEYLRSAILRTASNASYADYPLLDATTSGARLNLSLSQEESRWMSLQSQDIYINEAMNILADMQQF